MSHDCHFRADSHSTPAASRAVRRGHPAFAIILAAAGAIALWPSATRAESPPGSPTPNLRAEHHDGAEAREAADEARMLKKGMKSLSAYRAPSCDVAIAKIEALLRRGKGRWHERSGSGGLPGDLAGPLAQAELWARESEPVCTKSPAPPRFTTLRSAMQAIWQYPKKISRAQLDESLRPISE